MQALTVPHIDDFEGLGEEIDAFYAQEMEGIELAPVVPVEKNTGVC